MWQGYCHCDWSLIFGEEEHEFRFLGVWNICIYAIFRSAFQLHGSSVQLKPMVCLCFLITLFHGNAILSPSPAESRELNSFNLSTHISIHSSSGWLPRPFFFQPRPLFHCCSQMCELKVISGLSLKDLWGRASQGHEIWTERERDRGRGGAQRYSGCQQWEFWDPQTYNLYRVIFLTGTHLKS